MGGENFSPIKAQKITGLVFSKIQELGSLETKGPNKGKPRTLGSAVLYAPNNVDLDLNCYAGLEWIVDNLKDNIKILIECGAEEMYLSIGVFYKYQCNMAFEPYLLNKISDLNVSFWISCYEDNEEE